MAKKKKRTRQALGRKKSGEYPQVMRRISNKTMKLRSTHTTKTAAKKKAAAVRKQYGQARVVKTKYHEAPYAVYY